MCEIELQKYKEKNYIQNFTTFETIKMVMSDLFYLKKRILDDFLSTPNKKFFEEISKKHTLVCDWSHKTDITDEQRKQINEWFKLLYKCNNIKKLKI